MRRKLLLALLVIVAAMAAWLYWALGRPGPDMPIELEILPGTPATAILEDLHAAELLPSVLAGRAYLLVCGRGRSMHFGSYRFGQRCRPTDVLEQVLRGQVKTVQVTIIEGSTMRQISERYQSAGIGTATEWAQALEDTTAIHSFMPDAPSLEGFLFPETYRFSHATSAAVAVNHMLDRFHHVWRQEVASTPDLWGSPLEIVTLASLVEAETSVAEERSLIAGVFLNRLRRGMLLQCDPTVVYALQLLGQWQGRLLRVHWQIDHPYNTYRYPGLPPGPINSPGRAALHAALNPQQTDYLYFVASPGGGHTFSRTLKEHNTAVARLRHSQR